MNQLTIFDYISSFLNPGDILEPSMLGEPLRFRDLVTMAGEFVAVKQNDTSYRIVQLLKSFLPNKDKRSVLYDKGKHTCVCIEETGYDGCMYRIKKEMVQMVHVSFDLVDSFYLRVQEQRIEGVVKEDQVTKRICVSTSILSALRGIPQAAEVLGWMEKLGLPKVIHAYYLTGEVYYPTEEQVPDRSWTYEHWMLELPKAVVRKDYLITKCETLNHTDINGNLHEIILNAKLEPIKFQDNIDNLCRLFHLERGKYPENISFRTMIANLGEELFEVVKSWRIENEQISI